MAIKVSNYYLSEAQQLENAQYMATWFSGRGYTKNAICGLLGNMSQESNMNPGFWQRGGSGYGLVQWTPGSKYRNWAIQHGYPCGTDYSQPEKYFAGQLVWLDTLSDATGQWQHKSGFPRTFAEYKKSTQSPEWCALAFEKCFEQAGRPVMTVRNQWARRCWNSLNFSGNGAGTTVTYDESAAIIQKAISWAISKANDPNVYYHWGSGGPYAYDCSHFVERAYQYAGVSGVYYYETARMASELIHHGFHNVIGQVNVYTQAGLLPGDLLVSTGHHTAMYIGNGQIVEAATEHAARADQVLVRSYRTHNPVWDAVLRYKSGGQGGVIYDPSSTPAIPVETGLVLVTFNGQTVENGTPKNSGSGGAAGDKKRTASDISADDFLTHCRQVADYARNHHYTYGNSMVIPPTTDGKISCDRLIAKALWDMGFTDQPGKNGTTSGITVGNMDGYLTSHGWKKGTSFSDIKKGSIVVVDSTGVGFPNHTFVTISYDPKTNTFVKYDEGTQGRIAAQQPFTERWGYRKLYAVYNF